MYTFLLLGIESSLREKWRLLKSKLEEKNKGSSNGKPLLNFFKARFRLLVVRDLRRSPCGRPSRLRRSRSRLVASLATCMFVVLQ